MHTTVMDAVRGWGREGALSAPFRGGRQRVHREVNECWKTAGFPRMPHPLFNAFIKAALDK
jgi:hypothetical protein